MRNLSRNLLMISCFVLLAGVIQATQEIEAQKMRDNLLNSYMDKSVKELFKVWHTITNQSYDYNTIEGINRYKAFRANVAQIKKHNSENHSWKMGLNDFSDLTDSEVHEKFNLGNSINMPMNSRGLLSLDDYEDENEQKHPNILAPKAISHRALDIGARNQNNCGSCWAFSALAAMEINYNKNYPTSAPSKEQYLSTQELVDCDTSNNGCNGGWFSGAYKYYKSRKAHYEDNYKYTAKKGSCKRPSSGNSNAGVERYEIANTAEKMTALLEKGAVAVAVRANSAWYQYKSGLFNAACPGGVNHGVTLVGYGFDGEPEPQPSPSPSPTPSPSPSDDDDCPTPSPSPSPEPDCVDSEGRITACKAKSAGAGYWLIKNSWGTTWGEQGFMKLQHNKANNYSCMMEKYGYLPIMQ